MKTPKNVNHLNLNYMAYLQTETERRNVWSVCYK